MPDDAQTRAEQDAVDTEYTVDVRPDRMVPRRDVEADGPHATVSIDGATVLTRADLIKALLNVWSDWKDRGRRPSKEGPMHDLAHELGGLEVLDAEPVGDDEMPFGADEDEDDGGWHVAGGDDCCPSCLELLAQVDELKAREKATMAALSDAAEARALRRRVRELEKENEELRNALAIAFPQKKGGA